MLMWIYVEAEDDIGITIVADAHKFGTRIEPPKKWEGLG